MQKLYCYVDESGQDTKGELFLVSIIITEKELKDNLERALLAIEFKTGKKKSKWRSTSLKRKLLYIEGVLRIDVLRGCIFYGAYKNTREKYVVLTGESVAKAIQMRAEKEYSSTIVIDGLKPSEQKQVVKVFRTHRIHYRKVRGARDQSNAILRLADAMAGFIRDHREGKQYAKNTFIQFLKKRFVKEI